MGASAGSSTLKGLKSASFALVWRNSESRKAQMTMRQLTKNFMR